MKTLFIDTHLSDINLSLYNGSVLYKKEEVLGEKQNSRFIMPALEKLLTNEEYDEILVVNGPGSFTGVRLGVTIAKTLAYTTKKPIKVISYLDMLNISLDTKNHYVGLSDGNGYFISEYQDYQLVGEPYYLNNSDYKEFCIKNSVNTDVTINMEKVLSFVKEIDYINPPAVNPIYIKLIGVEYAKSSC